MRTKIMNSVKLLILCVCLQIPSTFADIDIVITDGMSFARPVAVVPFAWRGNSVDAPFDVAQVIAADLRRSGRFNPISISEMPEQPNQAEQVSLEMWKQKGVEAVVVGEVFEPSPGQYSVKYQLVDPFKPKQVLQNGELVINNDYLTLSLIQPVSSNDPRFYRRTLHQMADTIYEALTGQRGAFATQIAYVLVDRSLEKPFQLFIADSDGLNEQRLFQSKEAIMSPSWSPDAQTLAYVSFENGRSEVYSQKIYTGEKTLVAAFQGINSAPRFSPDGRRLSLTLSKDGNPEVYILNLVTREYRRLTRSNAFTIDTEASWAPDGESLVYTSDRGGRPQIYSVEAKGGPSKRMTFEGDYNASASYTPDGKSIILVNRREGVYHIAIQDIQTGIMQVLTDTMLDESPSLAPNGSMVIYATIYQGRQVLAAVSTDGRFKARLPSRRGDIRAPAWSPFLGQ